MTNAYLYPEMAIACPAEGCGAKVGEPCRHRNIPEYALLGQYRPDALNRLAAPHTSRRDAFAEAPLLIHIVREVTQDE